MQNSYYKSSRFEVIDIIEDYGLNFCLGNVVKYVLRAGKKTPQASGDLRKALDYLTRELARVEALEAQSGACTPAAPTPTGCEPGNGSSRP